MIAKFLTDMVGRKLGSIELDKQKDEIIFYFNDGNKVVLGVEADCCSKSWIEHLEAPFELDGALITGVSESDMPAHDGHKCDGACGHDVLAVYNTIFSTDRGDIILEYRNDSNGYYGGSLFFKGR